MGQISNSAIIILCIVGAGAALLIGWAIGHKTWSARDDDIEQRRAYVSETAGPSQYEYMRDLRERTKESIAAMGRPKRPRHHGHYPQDHTPMGMSTTDFSAHSGGQSGHY